MHEYVITSTVNVIFTYRIQAENLDEAVRQINLDEVEEESRFTDYDNAVTELLSMDGEDV
jgi:hypothetical protein